MSHDINARQPHARASYDPATDASQNYAADPVELFGFFNGTFLETMDADISSNGSTITMSLQKNGGGDLTMVFSSGMAVLDSSGATTGSIELTEGTATVPSKSFIYILESDKILTESTSSWPSAEHIKVAYYVVNNAAYVQANGALVQTQINDHASDQTTNLGHLNHIAQRIRASQAIYHSGLDLTLTVTGTGPSVVDLALSAGTGYQMHLHTIAAFDTDDGDDIHVVNDNTTPYKLVTDLADLLTDADNDPMTNKYFNLVFWMSLNKSGTEEHVFCNLPTGSYNVQADAETDVDDHDVFTVPGAFYLESPSALMLYRITLRHQAAAGGTWTHISTKELRGQSIAGAVAGGTVLAQTTFADSVFRVFDNGDDTKRVALEVSPVSEATTRTITMLDADIDLADVVQGPASADDNAIVTFNGAAGKLVQDVSNFTCVGSALATSGAMSIASGAGGNITLTPESTGDLLLDGQKWPQNAVSNSVLLIDSSSQCFWQNFTGTGDVVRAAAPAFDGPISIPGIGDGGLTNYDLLVGDVTTPDYGMIRFGNAVIGRTSYKAGAIDLDGAILIRNIGGPVTSEIEVIFTESTGNTCRFALPKSAVGNATYNPRSMLIAGPAPADTDFVKVTYWQGQGIFDNLVCDTAGDGADLGVQNDLEVEGDIFTDSIIESTAAAGVTIESVLLKDGLVDGIDVATTSSDLSTHIADASDPHTADVTFSTRVNTPEIKHTDDITIDTANIADKTVFILNSDSLAKANLNVENIITAASIITGSSFTSTVPNGFVPFTVTSTTRVANLNVTNSGQLGGKVIGTSGNTVPVLDGANTWEVDQLIGGTSKLRFNSASGGHIVGPDGNTLAIYGGDAAADDLDLFSTSHATRGDIRCHGDVIVEDDAMAIGTASTFPIDNFTKLVVHSDGNHAGLGLACFSNTAGNSGNLRFARARNTEAGKQAVQNGDRLAGMTALGWDGGAWRGPGAFVYVVDGAVSSDVVPCAIEFETGVTFPRTVGLRISSSSDVFIPAGDLEVTTGFVAVADGMAAPGAGTAVARIYVDTADGDLKVVFADGHVAVIAADS